MKRDIQQKSTAIHLKAIKAKKTINQQRIPGEFVYLIKNISYNFYSSTQARKTWTAQEKTVPKDIKEKNKHFLISEIDVYVKYF